MIVSISLSPFEPLGISTITSSWTCPTILKPDASSLAIEIASKSLAVA